MKKVFQKEGSKIIFYPLRYNFNSVGLILSVLYCLILFIYIYSGIERGEIFDPFDLFLLGISPILFFLLCVFFSTKFQVIIDLENNEIFKKNPLIITKIASLNDISVLRKTEAYSQYVTTYVYELVYRENKYKKGICLTPPLRPKSKMLKYLEETILKEITDWVYTSKEEMSSFENRHREFYKLVKIDENKYLYRKTNLFILGFGILIFAAFIFNVLNNNVDGVLDLLGNVLILAGSIVLMMCSVSKVIINMEEASVKLYLWGKQWQSVYFSEINDIRIKKTMNNGNKMEELLIAYYDNKNRFREFQLFSSGNNSKVARFANDIEFLLEREIQV